MSSIDSGRIEVKNLSNEYIAVTIPAGTYFVANSTSNHNMLVTSSSTFYLSPGKKTTKNLPTACMNLHRAIPNQSAGYTVGYTSNAALQNLVKLFAENNTPYNIRQAAVWIVTDNSTYDDTTPLSAAAGRSSVRAITTKRSGSCLWRGDIDAQALLQASS